MIFHGVWSRRSPCPRRAQKSILYAGHCRAQLRRKCKKPQQSALTLAMPGKPSPSPPPATGSVQTLCACGCLLGFHLLRHRLSEACLPEQGEPAQILPVPTLVSPLEIWAIGKKTQLLRAHVGVYTQTSPCRRLVSSQHPTSIPASSKREQGVGWDLERSQSFILAVPWHLSKPHAGPQTQV